jgi:translation initiation factor 1
MADFRLVYSTDGGRVAAGKPVRRRASASGPPVPAAPADGVVRLWRVKGGRGGKVVTVVTGLPAASLEDVGRELRKVAGAGGATRGDAVEIQGDCRERLQARLEAMGYRVKFAGG